MSRDYMRWTDINMANLAEILERQHEEQLERLDLILRALVAIGERGGTAEAMDWAARHLAGTKTEP